MTETTPNAPRCTECGKIATQQDIDGAWWPPCDHAKMVGLHTLEHTTPNAPTAGAELPLFCSVPPDSYGSAEWQRTIANVMDVARKRSPDNPESWAERWLRVEYDRGDLRALGFCRDCKAAITLCQVGQCVYSEPCGHYRAQGDLGKMRLYIDRRRRAMGPLRRYALLAMIGAAATQERSNA